MVQLAVPKSGLTLLENSTSTNESKNESKALQIMQLDLTEGVLEEIFKASRHGGKGVNVMFGKSIVGYHHTPIESCPSLANASSTDSQLWKQVTALDFNTYFLPFSALRLPFRKPVQPRFHRTDEPQNRHTESQGGYRRC